MVNMHQKAQKRHSTNKAKEKQTEIIWIRYKLNNKMTWIRASNTLKEFLKNPSIE
jgi:hypothetical protein